MSLTPPEVPPEFRSCGRCRNMRDLGFQVAFAYQPIVDLKEGSIWGHEALVRGARGESAWSVLSQVNEDNRYEFDQLCRTEAIRGAARLGLPGRLSINFIPNAVYHPATCIQRTYAVAEEAGFPLEDIVFEVTEGEHVRDRPHLVNIFREYRRYGFRTAIDDFGSGHAGLELLSAFQPDVVKLDMALVRGIDGDRARQAIVKGVMAMCGALSVRMLAEGVETPAERDWLAEQGGGADAGLPVRQAGPPAPWRSEPGFLDLNKLSGGAATAARARGGERAHGQQGQASRLGHLAQFLAGAFPGIDHADVARQAATGLGAAASLKLAARVETVAG